jgi:large subunit ribosomal protein L13
MTMKTYSLKAGDIKRDWHVIDATDEPLGRLASRIAFLIRGKHRPTYTPHLDMGDFVVVVNAEKVKLTGRKPWQKTYFRHTGYPGGGRLTPYLQMKKEHPTRIIEKAVKGMLPHNRLGRRLFHHLKVYAGPTHPHEAQIRGNAKASEQAAAGESAE